MGLGEEHYSGEWPYHYIALRVGGIHVIITGDVNCEYLDQEGFSLIIYSLSLSILSSWEESVSVQPTLRLLLYFFSGEDSA